MHFVLGLAGFRLQKKLAQWAMVDWFGYKHVWEAVSTVLFFDRRFCVFVAYKFLFSCELKWVNKHYFFRSNAAAPAEKNRKLGGYKPYTFDVRSKHMRLGMI